ncbi:hypothetical protein CH365_06995 [Leptospira neocaledonica]|uniref:Yip1 domain-containing protein n=1 Tax=Leptospira neocaledonica TaxID=2023192 RepID=A0A2N0A1K4_9LEPT|nr:hypothetical protein CH365_06995 [Leptospira neocaledonica]
MNYLREAYSYCINFFNEYVKTEPEVLAQNVKKFLIISLIGEAILIVFYVILNLVVTYTTNYEEVVALNIRMRYLFDQREVSPFLYSMNTYPYTVFWGAFFIILFQTISILSRWGLIRLFSEKYTDLQRIALAEIHSFSRFFISLFPLLFIAKIFPQSWKLQLLPLIFYVSVYMLTILFGAFFYLKRWILVTNAILEQPKGRSIITWSFPLLITGLLVWIAYN